MTMGTLLSLSPIVSLSTGEDSVSASVGTFSSSLSSAVALKTRSRRRTVTKRLCFLKCHTVHVKVEPGRRGVDAKHDDRRRKEKSIDGRNGVA